MAFYPVKIPWGIKPPMGTPLRAGHWSTQGLKGVWAFNEGAGSQFFDGSGGYTGAVNSRATLTSDGLSFGGTSGTADNPNVGTGPALGPLSQSTVLAVAKTLSSAANIADTGDSIYSERAGSGLDIFKIALVNVTTLQAEFTYRNDSGTILQQRISAVGANNGAWHTFAATKNGSAHTIYLDGKGATGTYAGTSAFTNANIQCLIGGDAADTYATWGSAAAGAIMFVARYDRALSAEEIKSLTENPWQIYQPRTIWIPVSASGGGGTVANSLDALIQRTGIVQTTNIDALIQKTLSQSVNIDSLVSLLKSGQISIDAFVQITQGQNVSIDSLIQAVKSNTLSLDAFIQIIGSSIVSLDSLVQATKEGTVSIDSLLFSVFSNQTEIDAFIYRTFGNSTSLDAIILAGGTYSSTLLDALLQEAKSQTVSLDALLKVSSVSITSIDGLLQSLKIQSVGIDAIILGALASSVSLDSLLQITKDYSVSLDALLSLVKTGSVSMDAIAMIVVSNSLNLDALLFRSLTNGVGLDAIVGGIDEVLTYVKRVLTVIYNDRNILVEAKDRTLTIH